jgi:hypothetical protein
MSARIPSPVLNYLKRCTNQLMASRPPDFVIGGEADPYMNRWFVIPRNRLFNIYAHEFIRSDDDRALHDHPWWNLSILLDGSYVEHTIAAGGIHRRDVRKAGDIKFRGARSAHRIELHEGRCRTLFVTGPKLRDWGFHCEHGWRPWQIFTKPGDSGQIGRGCE